MDMITKKGGRIAVSWVVCITMIFASFAGPFAQIDAQACDTPSVSWTPDATKVLLGRDLKAGEFAFKLTQTSPTTDAASLMASNDKDGKVLFKTINYTKADTYLYTMEEVPGTNPDITYDTNKIYVTVVVTVKNDKLIISSETYSNGTSPMEKPIFTNTYTPSVSWTPDATKVLHGRDLKAGEFAFILTQTSPTTDMTPLTASNDKHGNVIFPTIKYNVAGTYLYTMEEVTGTNPDITYDTQKVFVTVKVTQKEDKDRGKGDAKKDQFDISVTYSNGTSPIEKPTFTNTYMPSWTPMATKVLYGRDLKAGEFAFKLTQTSPTTDATPLAAINDKDGNVIFPTIKYTKKGDYSYIMEEVKGPAGVGVDYDAQKITVTVVVKKNPGGTLVIDSIKYSLDPTFTNTYTADPVFWTPEVTKYLNGKTPADGMFEFTIEQIAPVIQSEARVVETPDAVLPETVLNQGELVPFHSFKYTKIGTYIYKITETNRNVPGFTYDGNTITATVVVTDNEQGKLVAKATYDGGQVFNNSYVGPGSITVTKKVDVSTTDPTFKLTKTFYAGLFTKTEEGFELVRIGEGEAAVDAIVELDVVNSADATATFSNLDLNKKYYVFEIDKKVDGVIIATDGSGNILPLATSGWTAIKYADNEITLDPENLTGAATITNYFSDFGGAFDPAIEVIKKVTQNGNPATSTLTFYVGLFRDAGLTELIAVKPVTTTLNASFAYDKDGVTPLKTNVTYYIAETDKDGKPLAGTAKELGFQISINSVTNNNAAVVLVEDGTTVTIVNDFKKSEEFPLTGDNSNMSLWLFLAMLGVAGAIAPLAYRKKENAND